MKLSSPLLLPLLVVAATLAVPALAGAGEAPRCTYVEVAKLPIRYVSEGLAPAVSGVINGTAATMLVDTGAFDTQLTMTGATRRDLALRMTGRYVEGIGGISRVYTARLNEIAVGPARSTRRTDMLVIGDANLAPAFDAIVGAPFLLQADLEIDLRAKQMRFFRPQDCDKTTLAIWNEDTIAVPFERSGDRSPNPHFTVIVNGKKLDAMIDTGAHHTVLLRSAAKRAGIDVEGPGVKRLPDMVGVGSERAPHWSAAVDSIQIGQETIRGAELGILESQGSITADILLGQDFLRAHRVLFAMSQKTLYLAYLGGEAFTRSTGLEPWMREEAETGNPDAQFTLASMYASGRGVTRDPAQARAWLDKAAAGGQPHANLRLGRQQMLAGRVADAIPRLRSALDQLPSERFAPLWLYVARLSNGEPGLARQELQASLDKQQEDDWPRPIADFYLGKLDAAGLLDSAAKEQKFARLRSCQADNAMAEWHRAQGDTAKAASLMATVRAHCAPAQPAAKDKDKAP
jgi:predicted aspartyl protease